MQETVDHHLDFGMSVFVSCMFTSYVCCLLLAATRFQHIATPHEQV